MNPKNTITLLLSGLIILSSYCEEKASEDSNKKSDNKTEAENLENRNKKIKEILVLAQNAMKGKKHKNAIEYYTKAARLGDTPSQCFLGSCYLYGLYGTPKDEEKAVQWYRRAARNGNKLAQEQLSRCFANGLVNTRRKVNSAKKSAKWAEKSHKPE